MDNLNRRSIILNAPHLVTTQNATSVLIAEPKIERLVVQFSPVQAGSGTPSPSNVRAISGWTEISARICGKNLFDNVFPNEDATVRYRHVYVGDSDVTFSTTCGRNSAGYTVLYALPGKVTWGEDTARNGLYSGNTRTVTPVNGYVTLGYRAGNNNAVPSEHTTQIEVGTTATTIEPFRGITPTASLGNTYYGGIIDLVSGTMRVTYGAYTVTNDTALNGNADGSFLYFNMATIMPMKHSTEVPHPSGACDKFELVATRPKTRTTCGFGEYDRGTYYHYVYIWDIAKTYSTITTKTDAIAKVKELAPTFVYELENPFTVQLTPQTITALRGWQTVSSPAGSVDITYWTR